MYRWYEINWQWRRQRSKGVRSFWLFRGQNIHKPCHQDAHFFLKKIDDFFKSSPSKHKGRQRRWDCFTVKIKQIKRSAVRYGEIVFSVHTINEAKQSNRQDRSQGGGSSSQVIWPCAPWCSADTTKWQIRSQWEMRCDLQ